MAIKQYPQYAQAYNNRGIAYCLKGDYDSGIADFTQAIFVEPKYSEALCNRGFAYMKNNEYDKSENDFVRACKLGNELACQQLLKH
jgi:tetratricopeptide (TPR) repeat protein